MSETTEQPAVEPADGTEQPAPNAEAPAPEPEPAEPEPAPSPEPDKPRSNGIERRFSEMAHSRRAAEQRAQQLEAELTRLRQAAPPKRVENEPQQLTKAEFEQAVRQEAVRIAAQEREQAEARQAETQRATWFNAGEKTNPAFREQCVLLGNLAPDDKAAASYLDAVMDLDNGHAVTRQLAENPEEAVRILSLPPVKMGREIARLAAKPAPTRQVSQAPAPIKATSGTAKGATSPYDKEISYQDYIKSIGLA